MTERVLLTLEARDNGQNAGDQVNTYKERISLSPYLQRSAGLSNEVRLASWRRPNRARITSRLSLLSLECRYRRLRDEELLERKTETTGFDPPGHGHGSVRPVVRSDPDAETEPAQPGRTPDGGGAPIGKVKQAIANADQLEAELAEAERQVTKLEEGMASGDLYAWAINTVRQFKLPYKVEIPQFSQIDGPKDNSLLPNFPYKQATLTIGGTAFFHDFGRFLADFENSFPYARVLNLTLEPVSGLLHENREKLAFKMDISMLVKPGA